MKQLLFIGAAAFCLGVNLWAEQSFAQGQQIGATVTSTGTCPTTPQLKQGVGRLLFETNTGALCVSGDGGGGGGSATPGIFGATGNRAIVDSVGRLYTLPLYTAYTTAQVLTAGMNYGLELDAATGALMITEIDHSTGLFLSHSQTITTGLADPVPGLNTAGSYVSSVQINCSSGVVAATAATCTLAAASGKTTWITGFDCGGSGATAAGDVTLTVSGLISGTESYVISVPAGVTGTAVSKGRAFTPPIQASAANTAIVVSLPSLGAGSTAQACNAEGFQR
jgi:hypothetical protein